MHLKVHEQNGEFHCDTCCQWFKNKNHMKVHKCKHDKDRGLSAVRVKDS